MDADELDSNRTVREQWEFHWNHHRVHRELIRHLSEVCLLLDLYLHAKPATNGATR